jgi:uncharacterized protein YbaP (TraB family)
LYHLILAARLETAFRSSGHRVGRRESITPLQILLGGTEMTCFVLNSHAERLSERGATVIPNSAWRRALSGFMAISAFRFLAALFAALALGWPLPATAQRFEQGLLWRIEGGGAQPSHVFGTIHISDKRVQIPPAVNRALDEARSLSIEVGLDPANLIALAARMVFTDGRDLPGVVGPELYGRTAALTDSLGIPEPALRLFRPWAIALLLSVPQQDPSEVLDYVLAAAARAQGKTVHELETMEEQVGVFEGMQESDQIVLLRQAVENYGQMPRLIERMVEAYLARDLGAMSRLSEEMAGNSDDLRRLNEVINRRLLVERNARMAERIHGRLKEGSAVFAVGALHLYGDRGVLAQLEQRGWRVTRVY